MPNSEQVPEVTTAPVLKSWLSIRELHAGLREMGAPIYGKKDVFFRKLCEWEQSAAKILEEYLENKKNELALATEPVTPKILPGRIQPSRGTGSPHGEPLIACAVVRAVCDESW